MNLITQIVKKLQPPMEADPEKQRIANALITVIPAAFIFYLAFQIISFFKYESPLVRVLSLISFVLMMPIYIFSYRFYQQHAYRRASRLILAGLWLTLTFNLLIRGSILLQIYSLFYVLILLAGYLFSLREAAFTVFLTFLVTFFLWWGESFPWVTDPGYPPTNTLVVLFKLLILSIIGTFIIVTTHRIRFILHDLQQANSVIKKNEAQLAEANRSLLVQSNLLQTIIDNLPGRVAYISNNGRIEFMSRRFTDAGINPTDSIGKLALETLDEKQLELLTPLMAKALAGNPVEWEMNVPILGEERVINAEYIPHIVNAEVKGVISLARDVTDERKTEEAVRQAQKLHSLGLLAGGVAHDFNNLLSAIMGQSSLALVKMSEQHPAYRHIGKAVDASERAAALTQQMLAYSGRGQFLIQKLDINELIHANIQLFQVSVPKNVQIQTHYANELPLIEADAGQMQQIMMNLILNAAQAIGEKHGLIEVITSVREVLGNEVAYRQYTGEMLAPGRYVTVAIQDDGCGMNKETISKIFDPFFTTKESGSGLGLAAVLGIVRGHKGSLQVYSDLNEGTIFEILIPVAKTGEVDKSKKKEVIGKTAVSPTGSILIIDDETAVCETVTDILTSEGWHTYTATSGQQGLDIYQQHQAEIQLVLLDLSMPSMDGKETCYRLRQLNTTVHVILTSGYDKSKATQDFTDYHLAGFIQKPYHVHELVELVNRYAKRNGNEEVKE